MSDEPTLADVRDTAREVFGYRDLRPGQREAITALLDGRDVLLVLPTGAGKSAVYQLPGLELPGPTLVVSPLIALQQDQVRSLLELGDDDARAAAVSSAVPAAERRAALEAAAAGELEFLFLSPEQLANEEVLDAVRRGRRAAVEHRHAVALRPQPPHQEFPEVPAAADDTDSLHVLMLRTYSRRQKCRLDGHV